MFDFPDPLGPTTTFTPGVNSRIVASANDLNPAIFRAFTYISSNLAATSEQSAAILNGSVDARCVWGLFLDLERFLVLRGLAIHLDAVDLGSLRTGAAQPHDAIDLVAWPFEHGLDPTVVKGLDPSGHILLVRLLGDRVAELL